MSKNLSWHERVNKLNEGSRELFYKLLNLCLASNNPYLELLEIDSSLELYNNLKGFDLRILERETSYKEFKKKLDAIKKLKLVELAKPKFNPNNKKYALLVENLNGVWI